MKRAKVRGASPVDGAPVSRILEPRTETITGHQARVPAPAPREVQGPEDPRHLSRHAFQQINGLRDPPPGLGRHGEVGPAWNRRLRRLCPTSPQIAHATAFLRIDELPADAASRADRAVKDPSARQDRTSPHATCTVILGLGRTPTIRPSASRGHAASRARTTESSTGLITGSPTARSGPPRPSTGCRDTSPSRRTARPDAAGASPPPAAFARPGE